VKKSATFLFAAAAALISFAATSTPDGFTDDLDAALEASKKSGKMVFAVFSGSDWCYWCQVLEKEYLSDKAFVSEAAKAFELVYIDSPRDKSKLSKKAAECNSALVKKYGITGFPSVRFIKADGTATRASRPQKGMTPKEYALFLARGIANKPLIDKQLAPFEEEFEKLQKETMMKLMMMGDPFAKKTVAEQKDAYKKGAQVLKKGLDQMKKLRAKIAAKKVSAAISQDKNLLLKKVDAAIAQAAQYSKMSFNDAKKLRSKGIEIEK
jgi:thioredoxin-related protein